MPAILVSPPQAEPVTLAEAKAHLRVAHDEEDLLIGQLIASARRVVEAQSGLCLMAQGWTCFLDAFPAAGAIALPIAPLRAVDEVAVFGEDDQKAVIDPAHYVADFFSRPPRLLLRGSRQWPRPGRRLNGIGISVQAGFASAAAVPPPLRQAVLLLVAHWFANRGDAAAPPLPPAAAALIAPFREVRP